jgi:glycosyltransferase 2 family protein
MTVSTEQKRTSWLQVLIRTFVSIGLMVWLIGMMDWKQALQMIKEGSPLYLVVAFLAIQLTVSTSIWKWKLLIDSSEKNKDRNGASMKKLGRIYYIGLFFNNFLPGSVGGDVVRIYYLGKKTGVSTATTSVLFERITSGGALVGIVILSAFFMDDARPYLLSLFILIGIVLVLYLFIKLWLKKVTRSELSSDSSVPLGRIDSLMKKGKQEIIKIGETAKDYRNEGWIWWLKIGILSLLFQVGMAWINDLLFLSFGIDIPLLELLVIITLISVITMLPVSLNGLGVREASYVFFFNELGVPEEIALSVSLLFFFLVSISSLVGGIFWLSERRRLS